MEAIGEKRASCIQERLLDWFERNSRDFPWRHTRNAYVVLVTEKLLQQTAAREPVVRAFHELTTLYPSVPALARAEDSELQRILAPLGFHYRAKELKVLARTLLEQHSGSVPADLKQLKALPGVGDYMARAVLSFAYGRDVAVVDTNVARFLYRVFAISGPMPSNPARKRMLLDMAQGLVPGGRSKDFNLAVLDLCALVCTPTKPKCAACPVQPLCDFGQKAVVSEATPQATT